MARATEAGGFAGRRAMREAVRFVGDCDAVVRRAYAAVMKRGAVRRALHAGGRDHQLDKAHSKAYAGQSALAVVMHQMERLRRSGANLAELLRFAEVLYETAFELAGAVPRSLDAIDLEEQRMDADEDVLQMRRRVNGATTAGLYEEADLCARVAATMSERARALRLQAMALPVRATA
ncbi:MAG: hypothetical protein KF709_02495 [Gemmatimonadaceae bacterium]|nr:hypothetical protein [Gemmatimonadaceae bacterium]